MLHKVISPRFISTKIILISKKITIDWRRWLVLGLGLAAVVAALQGGALTYSQWLQIHNDRALMGLKQSASQPVQHKPSYLLLRKRHNILVSNMAADTPLLSPAPLAPVFLRVSTAQPVVFVTIDDGIFKTREASDYITAHQLPYSVFLTTNALQGNPDYFRVLQQTGTAIQNHTISHPSLSHLDYEQQKHEICASADILQQIYGQRPTLFRPPYGDYNADTQRATTDCGMKAVVLWSALVQHGQLVLQVPHTKLEPGDIVLFHFRPELAGDLQSFMKIAAAQGLSVAHLEDYLR